MLKEKKYKRFCQKFIAIIIRLIQTQEIILLIWLNKKVSFDPNYPRNLKNKRKTGLAKFGNQNNFISIRQSLNH